MDDPELMTSVPSNIITLQNSQIQGPLASHAPTLMPGEILKNSGKFTAPSKIPGKIFLKDEVIIRNADSGKGIIHDFTFLSINSSCVSRFLKLC